MKKTIFVLLLAAGFCFMTSCDTTESKETTASDTTAAITENAPAGTEETEETPATFYTVVELDNGAVFEMGAIADATVAALGEPQSVAEAPSCVHEGNDVLYTYNGFTLTTSPDANGNARIQEIALTSDAVSFVGGLSIGSDKAAVESVFGTEYTENFGVLTFTLDGATVSIVLDEDECVSSLVITAK